MNGADVQNSALEPKANRFRNTLLQKGITANALARATGLSASLIEKLKLGDRSPSTETARKIEDVLAARIWSPPADHRSRKRAAQIRSVVLSLMRTERVDESYARQIAASRFPRLFLPDIASH